MKARQYVTPETLTDDATPSIIKFYHTNSYELLCGFLAKKSTQIHAKNKWYLIINVLRATVWHRHAKRVSVSDFTY